MGSPMTGEVEWLRECSEGMANYRLLDAFEHGGVVDEAVPALDILWHRTRMATPGRSKGKAESAPDIDANGAISELHDRLFQRLGDTWLSQGPGMDDDRGAERPPQPLVGKANGVIEKVHRANAIDRGL